jgi:hypothetical protein
MKVKNMVTKKQNHVKLTSRRKQCGSPDGQERRRKHRIKVRLPLIIRLPKNDILTYTTNVSLLGAYVESRKKLKPSTQKREFILELTPSRKIRCLGVILRCEPKVKTTLFKKSYYHLNIFFSNFLDNGEQRLAVYLEEVLTRQKRVLDRWIKKRKAKMSKWSSTLLFL